MYLKQNESMAARRRWYFTCVDATDGFTPETGLTFSGSELQISKNGGAFANFAGSYTELSDGLYYYEATVDELDTLGALAFKVEKSGVRTTNFSVGQVVAFDPYNGSTLGLGTIDATQSTVNAIFASMPSANQIVNTLMAYSHDTGVTVKGLFRRLDALVAGKATGLRGVFARYFMRDGSTVAIGAAQDVSTGARQTADVSGSEA